MTTALFTTVDSYEPNMDGARRLAAAILVQGCKDAAGTGGLAAEARAWLLSPASARLARALDMPAWPPTVTQLAAARVGRWRAPADGGF